MSTANNPGLSAHYINLAGSSSDGHAHGGSELPAPPMVSRRVQVRSTDDPRTDRWIALTTVRLTPTPLFRVGVVDGRNAPVEPPADYPTLRRARNAANRLCRAMTEENG